MKIKTMDDTTYYFIERILDCAWLTGSFQWTHDPNQAWKTTDKTSMNEIVMGMFRNRCIVTEHVFIDAPTAYEWHNLTTGHSYVDYIPHVGQGEKDGYTKFALYRKA